MPSTVLVLDWRFPYIHQLPVFDLDYITTIVVMFARNWWIEGPWKMLFSMPYAPWSVETATPDLRYGMYQSWPPGAVLSLYLVAKLTGTEPNITMVNWLNTAGHGLIALFLALSAYLAANILRRPKIEAVALAILAGCLVLLPRGPVFFFSQVYAFDTHIVVFYAFVIFAATLELGASGRSSAELVLLPSDRDFRSAACSSTGCSTSCSRSGWLSGSSVRGRDMAARCVGTKLSG